ncbi:MAG: DUF1294 domain-containing protein [Gemmataceae bacterium]|nr:DUF1294 domain-containing protein [Gemmataceae bacterium]
MGYQGGGGRYHPVRFHAIGATLLSVLIAVGLWAALSGRWTWAPWLAAWLVAVNLTAVAYYRYDKWQAQRVGRRVPEVVLHGLAFAGGSPGAYAAMQLFRHKTIKGSFRVVFWIIVVLQAALLAWIVYHALTTHSAFRS